MDLQTQKLIDSILGDVNRCLGENRKDVGYINWNVHLEEVRSFKHYRKFCPGAEEAFHESMKPIYWLYLTGGITYKDYPGNLIEFLRESFSLFDGGAAWIGNIGILDFVEECLNNDCSALGFQSKLQNLIEQGYRPYIQHWPMDEIDEFLERLEVVPDYRRGEFYCILSAYSIIENTDLDDKTKTKLEKQLSEMWDYIVHIYSVMVRSIVGCKLGNYTSIANTVKVMTSCHQYAYLFYDAVILRQDDILAKYDGMSQKKKQQAVEKFEKHLAYLQNIIENTEQKDDLEMLCKIIFGEEFEAVMNRKRFKSYKELEGMAEHWKQEAAKLEGTILELAPLKYLVESMKAAMDNALPMDEVVNSIIGFDDPKVSELVFNKLDWDLEDQPAWSKRRKEMKKLIKAKLHGGEVFQKALEEYMKQIADATNKTAGQQQQLNFNAPVSQVVAHADQIVNYKE